MINKRLTYLLSELVVQGEVLETDVRVLAQDHSQLVLKGLVVRHEEIGVPVGVALPQQRFRKK